MYVLYADLQQHKAINVNPRLLGDFFQEIVNYIFTLN